MSGLLSVRTPQNRRHLEPLNQGLIPSDPQICGSQALVWWLSMRAGRFCLWTLFAQAHNHPSLSAAVAKLQLKNWKGYECANLIPAWPLANHDPQTAPAVFSFAHHPSYNCRRPASVCNIYYCSLLHQSRGLRLAWPSGQVAKQEIIYESHCF